MQNSFSNLPANLPIPKDDGLANHLTGMMLPELELPSSKGKMLITQPTVFRKIFYCYPMIGNPMIQLPENWDKIAGARGCTPQTISIKESQGQLKKLNTETIGISTQTQAEIIEATTRLEINHSILSDCDLQLTTILKLPTFKISTKSYLKRLTMIVKNNKIIKIFYPIFPPDKHIFEVIDWLTNNK